MKTPEPKTIDEYRDALETLNRDEMLVGLRLQVAEIQTSHLKIEALTKERDALKAEVAVWIMRSDKTWFEKQFTEQIDALKAELARPESTAVSLMRAENVALKDAAWLALDALEPYKSTVLRIYTPQDRAITALKAVLE